MKKILAYILLFSFILYWYNQYQLKKEIEIAKNNLLSNETNYENN